MVTILISVERIKLYTVFHRFSTVFHSFHSFHSFHIFPLFPQFQPLEESKTVNALKLDTMEFAAKEERTAEKGHGQRRSARVDLQLPVSVRWVGQNGAREERETMTLVVN